MNQLPSISATWAYGTVRCTGPRDVVILRQVDVGGPWAFPQERGFLLTLSVVPLYRVAAPG